MKKELKEIMNLNPKDFCQKELSEEDILRWFEICGAVWFYNGDPKKPHAQLTSGLCTNGYFDCFKALQFPNLNEILSDQLLTKLVTADPEMITLVDWVIGPSPTAIPLVYEIAKGLNVRYGSIEKDPVDSKKMLWRRSALPKLSGVLLIDDIISTFGTIKATRQAIEISNEEQEIDFLSTVGTLVYRPSKLPVDCGSIKVVALIEKEVWAIKPEDCPLCKAGSPRYKPKTHWKELTDRN